MPGRRDEAMRPADAVADADEPGRVRTGSAASVPVRLREVFRPRWVFVAIGAAALAIYLGFDLAYLPAQHVFPDEHRFMSSAVALWETGEYRTYSNRAYEMPGVPIVYSILYGMTGSESGLLYAARALQAVLLLVQAVLVAGIAGALFRDPGAARLALVATLFYPFYVYYQGLLLSEPLFDLLLVASIYALFRWREHGFRVNGWLVAASLLFGLGVYVKATLALVPPLIVGAYALLAGRSPGRAFAGLGVSMLILLVLLAPWWARNYAVFDDFVPFTTSSGRVFFTGNNPANHTGGAVSERDEEQRPDISRLDELDRHRAYTRAALDYIAEHPGRFVELAGLKFLRFWRLYPYAEGWDTGVYKWGSLASYGIVLALALACLARNARHWREMSPMLLLIAWFTLIHMIMVSSIRYRLPIEAFLIVLASEPASALWRRVRPASEPVRPRP